MLNIISLVPKSEGRRQQMKKIISLSPKSPAVTRTVPPEVINHFIAKIESLQDSIKAVLQAEYVANLDAKAQMEMQRAQVCDTYACNFHSFL